MGSNGLWTMLSRLAHRQALTLHCESLQASADASDGSCVRNVLIGFQCTSTTSLHARSC